MTADKGTLYTYTNITCDIFYRQLNNTPSTLHHFYIHLSIPRKIKLSIDNYLFTILLVTF